MAESVPVQCPACLREHSFSPPTFPCACGAPLTLPMLRGADPVPLGHPTWENSWVAVRCASCARVDQWPQPELGCTCGAVLHLPVAEASLGHGPVAPGEYSAVQPARTCDDPRPAFQPVTIRTSRDAVTAAGLYLKWLGFTDLTRSGERPASGIDIRGSGVVAQVDPATSPSRLRDIECLWLHGLNTSSLPVFFSLAGYAHNARARADDLCVPLFVMDLTGTPQPVNDAADDLLRTGAIKS
ncbi:hypothetical protein [Streptomyces meridianus]|uniref:Uncharacterized protein n=1 Tax=Streptomyces meridianus TaxID=2938945 RepID=A0ABT0X272_9ACTN|nr:hypothetical protein [Streptomyces meridianus]MCM2576641.1 hypothetical protein [Streptomyces meridianus]